VTAFTAFIGWAPIKGVPDWLAKLLPASWRNAPGFKSFGMPTGLDEQYTWMSLATLVGFVMIAWDMMVARQAELSPATAAPPAKVAAEKQPEPVAGKVDEEAERETAETEAKTEAGQPEWRARMERRKHGGKRRRNRS
jgi:hypothetical protein